MVSNAATPSTPTLPMEYSGINARNVAGRNIDRYRPHEADVDHGRALGNATNPATLGRASDGGGNQNRATSGAGKVQTQYQDQPGTGEGNRKSLGVPVVPGNSVDGASKKTRICSGKTAIVELGNAPNSLPQVNSKGCERGGKMRSARSLARASAPALCSSRRRVATPVRVPIEF